MELKIFQEKLRDFFIHLEVEKNVSKHTLRAYENDLRQFSTFWEGIVTKEPRETNSLETIVRRYSVALFYKKITKTSLARKFSSLRSFASFLKRDGIEINLSLKSPRLDKKLPHTLTIDEISYLLDTLKTEDLTSKFPYRDKAIFELMYATGVRCSELVNIKIHDINLEERSIRVLGKGNRERFVLFGEKALKAVDSYVNQERFEMIKHNTHNSLFVNYNGTPLTTRSVQRIFTMFRTFLKLDRVLTPHKVRHSFATHLLNQGVNLRVIQELLGHKTIATTEIYTHVSNQQLAKMCEEKHPLNNINRNDRDQTGE